MKPFAAQLLAQRTRLHLSQVQCAALFPDLDGTLHVTGVQISKWESEIRTPTGHVQKLMIDHLKRQKPQKDGQLGKRGRPAKA